MLKVGVVIIILLNSLLTVWSGYPIQIQHDRNNPGDKSIFKTFPSSAGFRLQQIDEGGSRKVEGVVERKWKRDVKVEDPPVPDPEKEDNLATKVNRTKEVNTGLSNQEKFMIALATTGAILSVIFFWIFCAKRYCFGRNAERSRSSGSVGDSDGEYIMYERKD